MNKNNALLKQVLQIQQLPKNFTITAGFDGFIDMITKPAKTKESGCAAEYYKEIFDFGEFLTTRANKSCSVELDETDKKIGGNLPIYAAALSSLGNFTINCIGAFGYPDIDPVYKNMPKNCKIIPVSNPGTCIALEFNDGKVMLALNGELNKLNWEIIKQRCGMENIMQLYQKSDMITLLNWGEVCNATGIAKGLQNDIMPKLEGSRYIFSDLSDCSKKSSLELLEFLTILKNISKNNKLILSLNENETKQVCTALGITDSSINGKMYEIHKKMSAYFTVLHFSDFCYGYHNNTPYEYSTYKIPNPKILTGGGDNFNAGLCYAVLSGCTAGVSLAAASTVSSFYVKNGFSANRQQLNQFINGLFPGF